LVRSRLLTAAYIEACLAVTVDSITR